MSEKKIAVRRHYDYMILALVPIVICSRVLYSTRVLLLAAVAMLTARAVDVLVANAKRQAVDLQDKSSTAAALAFVLMLPVSIPLYMVAADVALTVAIGKYVFGGKGAYPFNLAALAMCTAMVNWPLSASAIVTPFTNVSFWSGAAEQSISNAAIIKNGGLPYTSLFNLLLGNCPGKMGTGFIIILFSVFIVLVLNGKITRYVTVPFLATVTAIALIFPRITGVSRFTSAKYEILSSSLIYCSIFLLNEPTTTPRKKLAKVIFGILCGALTMIFRYFGAYEEGVCFAILLSNATEGMWDKWLPRLEGDDVGAIYISESNNPSPRNSKKKQKSNKNSRRLSVVQKTAEIRETGGESIKKSAYVANESQKSDQKAKIENTATKQGDNTTIPRANRQTTGELMDIYSQPEAKGYSEINRKKAEDKNVKKHTKHGKQSKKKNDETATYKGTIDIIGRAEDKIDRVDFSTRMINIDKIREQINGEGKNGQNR
jgi:electron transport complex protein RnfD